MIEVRGFLFLFMPYARLDKVKSLMGLWGDTEHSVFADNQEGCGVKL